MTWHSRHTHFFSSRFTIVSSIIALVVISIVQPTIAEAVIFEPGFETEIVATGFTLPVAMSFADGRIFVAEKSGTVRVIKNGILLAEPVITLTDINTFGDRGLLGIVVDPNFASNGYLYLSYTYENTPGSNVGGEKTGRIVRVTVVGDTALESTKVVLVGTVGGASGTESCDDFAVTADCIPSDSSSHSVGGLRFGPDGKLYATLGDGANFDYADPKSLRAQNLDSLAGKVLRINTDGTGVVGNPFYTGNSSQNRSKVFAYGVRNSFRLNFSPSGSLFSGDVGWSSWEEVNRITAGSNYGWPCWEGTSQTTHNCVASTTAPVYKYAHDAFGAGSVTAGSFPSNDAYPDAYDRSFFFGDYAQNWIKRLVLDQNDNLVSVHDFMDNPDGPVDVSTGPDGTIYYLSIYTGSLNRITHTTGNRRPVVAVQATPVAGLAPLQVAFTSTGSYDPDADALVYSWNFSDGSVSNAANPTHTFTANGSYEVTLTLTDAHGSSAAKTILIRVGNQAPTASITSPTAGYLYSPNDIIQLTGEGVDSEDGVLPASAFAWQIILHHNTHTHIEQQFSGTKNPWFIAPDHSSSDVYTEIVLTVTDSNNLKNTASTNVYLDNGAGTAGNLIQNASVEIPADGPGGNPLNWLRGNYGFNNPTFTYPAAGLEGSKAVNISMDFYSDGGAKWFFSPLYVSAGEEYVYSHFYTSNVSTSVFAQIGLANGTYLYPLLGVVPPAATSTKVSFTIRLPEGAQTMTVWNELNAVGSLTTDNFSLTRVNQAADTVSPLIRIDAPAGGSTVTGTSTQISVTAGDSGGVAGVTLFIDGTMTGAEDSVAPYAFIWNTTVLSNGTHTITARARDIAGNVATATPVTVTVSNTVTPTNLIQNGNFETTAGALPLGWSQGGWGNHTRTFTYPIVGYNGGKAARTDITNYPAAPAGTGDSKWAFNKIAVTPGTQYTYSDHYRSNTISDIIGQYTLSDGSFHYFGLAKEIQPTLTWAQITRTFTPPANATHVTFFHLISAVGYVEIDDAQMYVNGTGTPSETNTPIVAFTNPLEGQIVRGTIGVTASSSDDTAVTYIFYAVDGIPVTGQITTAPYLFNWDSTSVANGVHVLKATTHDPSGNNSTHTISVTVDNTVAPPVAGNLIVNPSLETAGVGGDPDSWFRGGWGTNTRVFTYPVAGIDGTKAAKVEISSYTDGDAKWYFADVPVTAGTSYVVNYDARSNTETEVLARIKLTNGTYQYLFLATMPSSNSTWQNLVYTIPVPVNGTHVTLFHVLHSVGSLEIDHFRLVNPATGGDTIAPIVALTAPVDSSIVSGSVTLTASSTDNVAVTAVTFFVDSTAVFEDTTAPYSFLFDTNSIANGGHAISARARDVAGNVATSTPISVTVSNASALQSLIQNPSFEEGLPGTPSNWTSARWGTNTTIFTHPVAGIVGASAARIEMTSYTNGDAKWRHDDVAVTPGAIYTFTHSYRANVLTNITARYTLTNGTFQYVSLGNFPAASAWTSITQTFVAPAGATSVTIFHIMNTVGWLEVDSYVLTDGNQSKFNNGMISLTFDDGWLSHYTTALPILNAANVDGVFYIITNETLGAVPQERIGNPSLETVGTGGDPENWFRGGWGTNTRTFSYPALGNSSAKGARLEITSYTDGDAKWYPADATVISGEEYSFSSDYNSTTATEMIVRYTKTGGAVQYQFLANLPSTNGAWQTYTQTVKLPGDAVAVTIFHVIHSAGSLTIDNYSVKRVQDFVDVSQVLTMQSAGHEVAAHTRTHPQLPTLSTAAAQDEITGSRTALLGMGITAVDSIAYPFGEFNVETQSLVQSAGFTNGRGVEHGYNTKSTDKYALKIQRMDRTTTVTDVQGWIAQAKLDKTWLVLMFHQIDNDPLATLGVSASLLQQTVDAVVSSGIEVVSMRQGTSRMNP